MSEFVNWKANVNEELRELKERVSMLELAKYDSGNNKGAYLRDAIDEVGVIYPKDTGSIVPDSEVRGCLRRWNYHLQSSRSAKFQFLLLLSFVGLFVYFGVTEFVRARRNENSDYKPEKKESIRNYEDGKSTEVYDMPYFYFHFYVSYLMNSRLDRMEIEERLEWMQASINYFPVSCDIVYYSEGIAGINETYAHLEPEEVVLDYNSAGVDTRGFWAWFRVKYEEPDPSKGYFYLMIHLQESLIGFTQFIPFDSVFLTITRELKVFKPFRGVMLNRPENKVEVYVVSYQESVTSRLGTNNTNNMETHSRFSANMPIGKVQQLMNISADVGDIVVMVLPDLRVDHWEEYVEYGYWDWVTALGGLFSITCAVFFWVSYYGGIMLGHDTVELGILGEMSWIYWNIENIYDIKRLLKHSHIGDDQNFAAGTELTTLKKEGEY